MKVLSIICATGLFLVMASDTALASGNTHKYITTISLKNQYTPREMELAPEALDIIVSDWKVSLGDVKILNADPTINEPIHYQVVVNAASGFALTRGPVVQNVVPISPLIQSGIGMADMEDQLCYLTRTPDGKILKSSSIYIRDDDGNISAIFSINYDISALAMAEDAIRSIIQVDETQRKEPERITLNVSDLLDDLIRQADELVGKPVALMTKEDKIKAVQFLGRNGAMLITKSGDKISKHFGISKYTLYSYLDNKTGGN